MIEARGIRNAFGATQALAGADLTAPAGRVAALLDQTERARRLWCGS